MSKCDKLEAIHFMTHFDGDYEAFYPKAEADKVISDLETKLKEEREFGLGIARKADHTIARQDEEIARLLREVDSLKESQRWRKFSEEEPAHQQWIFVINPRRSKSKYASPIETRRWDEGMKFDVKEQGLYNVWMPQMKAPEEADK